MSRSKNVGFRVPHPVMDAVEIRRSRGEYGKYRNLSELEIGQNRYAAFFPREHLFTVALAREHEEIQNRVDDFALRLAEHAVLLAEICEEKPVTAPTII